MDDATFQQLMAVQRSKALPVPPLDAPVGDSQASPQPVMDDATFQRLRASVQNSITSATPSLDATQPAPAQGNTSQGATPTLSPPGEALSAALEVHPPPSATLDEPDPEEPLGHPSSFLDAAAGGAAESFLQTKDFLTGGAPVDKSPIRAAIEAGTQTAENSGFVPGTVGVLSQFTMGMLGAGKIAEGASLVSAGAKAALEALPKVTAAGEAAAAGAVAFDPHQDFLSPIVQYVPFIGEPLAAAIGSNEDTPDLYGRLKNALQSIGVDAAVAGTVIAASKVYRALAAGDHGAASVATGELQDAHDAHQAAQAAAEPVRAPEAAIPSSEPVPATGSPEASQAPEIVPPTAAQEAHPAVPTEGGPSVSFEEAPGQPTEAPGAQEAQPATSAAEVAPGAPEDTLSAPEAASDETAPDNAAPTPENPKFKPSVTVTPEEAESILSSSQSDIDALTEHGTVQGAVDAGHVFGQGQGIPWNKLHLPGEVDDFVARVSDTLQAKLDAAKGGDILSDATVLRQVNGMASYFNINPAVITSRIAQAGNDATRMVANMDAAYLLANRMHQDAWALGQRINLGDLTGFATREDAVQEFQRQVTMASSMLASGQSMRASAGRAMRHGRSEFAVNPELAAQVQQLGGDKLLALFNATAGNPKLLKRVTQPGFMKRAMGDFGFLVQNNLLWSWQTHLVNFLSNAYMLAARPAERIVGGALTGDAASVREAFAQYGYYVSLFPQAFPSMWRAFLNADSVLAPRATALVGEASRLGPLTSAATGDIREGWRPFDSVPNTLFNGYLSLAKTLGLPTRALAASDEMMKQVIYRSKVAANAWVNGTGQGLKGKDLAAFVQGRLDASVNAAGQAVDQEAAQEAKVATFSQDLLPGTLGRTVQTAVGQHPLLRLILPFTQTPVNIFRYSQKLIPGVNIAQTEFRNALLGKVGRQAQSQAAGQMALGTMALWGIAMSGLNMTGGGPQDPNVRAELMATGWRPYSLVYPTPSGGKGYFPIGRIDPIALPFGIVADIQDYLNTGADASKAQAAV